MLYYRVYGLKQVDRDGKLTYSNIVNVKFEGAVTFKVLTIRPNPVAAGQQLMVVVESGKKDNATLQIIDGAGRVLAQK